MTSSLDSAAGKVIIRFADEEDERRGFEFLLGRWSFKAWQSGEFMLAADALGPMALEGIRFAVEEPARYEHVVPTLTNAFPRRAAT